MNVTLLIVVLAIYFLGMVGIGLVGRKYATSFDSFVSAGRNAGVLMIIGSAVGSQIGNGLWWEALAVPQSPVSEAPGTESPVVWDI